MNTYFIREDPTMPPLLTIKLSREVFDNSSIKGSWMENIKPHNTFKGFYQGIVNNFMNYYYYYYFPMLS